MVSRADYEAVIDSFLMDMSAICGSPSEARLRELPGFAGELAEATALLRDPATPAAEILGLALGTACRLHRPIGRVSPAGC